MSNTYYTFHQSQNLDSFLANNDNEQTTAITVSKGRSLLSTKCRMCCDKALNSRCIETVGNVIVTVNKCMLVLIFIVEIICIPLLFVGLALAEYDKDNPEKEGLRDTGKVLANISGTGMVASVAYLIVAGIGYLIYTKCAKKHTDNQNS